METKTKVAYQGERGAYSEQAAYHFFDQTSELVPYPTFKSLFEGLDSDEIEYATIPIENSLAGSVHENYDLLLRHNPKIIGEIFLRISHNLLAVPGTKLSEIRKIFSHPQALGQCREFIEDLGDVQATPQYDTAGSAKMIAELNCSDTAAIASSCAGTEYNLATLAKSIESNQKNFTRFLIIVKQNASPKAEEKTSIIFSTKDMPGALFKSLAVFALRDINLLKIESRPFPERPFQYIFYLDFEGSIKAEAAKNALRHLEETTDFVHILGSYPKGKTIENPEF